MRRGKFVFEIRQRLCGLCLVGKIVPEHCTTILQATLQKICAWPWKCQISLDILKIVVYVGIIEFYKGVAQLRGRQIIEDFIHKGSLCMEAPGFKGVLFFTTLNTNYTDHACVFKKKLPRDPFWRSFSRCAPEQLQIHVRQLEKYFPLSQVHPDM